MNACSHQRVRLHSRQVHPATLYEPAEIAEWAECLDCGETLDTGDLPEDVEIVSEQRHTKRDMLLIDYPE